MAWINCVSLPNDREKAHANQIYSPAAAAGLNIQSSPLWLCKLENLSAYNYKESYTGMTGKGGCITKEPVVLIHGL